MKIQANGIWRGQPDPMIERAGGWLPHRRRAAPLIEAVVRGNEIATVVFESGSGLGTLLFALDPSRDRQFFILFAAHGIFELSCI